MKPCTFLTFLMLGLVQISQINGAKILFYMGMASYSHRAPLDPLVDALAARGHNVTFLSAFPSKSPNPQVVEFNPPIFTKYMTQLMGFDFDVYKYRKDSEQILQVWINLPPKAVEVCEKLYADPVFLKWMNTSTFDLIVFDSLHNECVYGMVYHFKAKLIAFGTAIQYPWFVESHYGLPDETSSIPDGMTHMPINMNFFERTVTAMTPLMWKAYRELWFLPKLEQVTMKGLGLNKIPRFIDIQANTSLVFVNGHWTTDFPRSYPPHVISVGGIAGQGKSKPLPKKLEDFINKGSNFILISFGTVAEFTRFDPHIRQAFLKTMYKFPNTQFILKSTFPIKENLPANCLAETWLPQKDILIHPKIKAFITHGGLGGIYEAILAKTPMICLPILAEQDYNANAMEEKGYGIKLELVTLKEEELTDAVTKILTDDSYKKTIDIVSRLFTDRQIRPLDTAMWWVEFLLRNPESTVFLRPLSVTQSWWVRRQLDVWAFVFILVILIISIPLLVVYSAMKFILKKVSGSAGKPRTKLKVK